ncbi:MAG: aminotransferase class V-fold PLP-dependent enzyme [Clostridiales bacterium]|nr:aminotransferase class V-fold PLP-dependent enzyme [Clostridiales bacterium]
MIYMDNAATSWPKPIQVEERMVEALRTFGNGGRGAHGSALTAARMIYDTREMLAELFGASDPSRIAFTANSTASLNMAIQGLLVPGDHVITTECEHNSVLRPLYRLEKQGVELSILKADKNGILQYENLEKLYRPNTRAVVITHASNLTGNVTQLSRISSFTQRHGLLLIMDASQTAGVLPIYVEEMGIDVLCFTGHKSLRGPQGIGGIWVRDGLEIRPLSVGGSGIRSFDRTHPNTMPEALEAGTLNSHGIAGLYGALQYLNEMGIPVIYEKEMKLTRRFAEGVEALDNVKLYGSGLHEEQMRVPIVSLNIGDYDSASVGQWLWEDYEIAVRTGAHCAPLMHKALGTENQGAVRFSFSHYNTEEEVDTAIEAIRKYAL